MAKTPKTSKMKNYSVPLRCGTVLRLSDLEDAGLSYVPCARLPNNEGEMEDRPYFTFANLWGQRSQVTLSSYGRKTNAWAMAKWQKLEYPGVQLMTGKPTYRPSGRIYLYYVSIDIEAHMIESYPEQVAHIQQLYKVSVDGTPCILATKSGGLRLDAYIEYVGKKMSFKDEGGMLLEILADKCLARIDSRYSMIQGSILDMPTLPKETLQNIHQIISEIATVEESDNNPREVVEKSQLGDLDIEWDNKGRSQLFPTSYCQRTAHRSNRDEVRFTKHADGSVDGKCFNCGETWWEVEPPKHKHRQKPVRLLKKDDVSFVAEALEKSWKFLSEAFAKGKGLIGLRSDTGTGKDHHAILHFQQTATRGFYSVPTTEHAKETTARMESKELSSVFRYRGLHSDSDGTFPHEKPCINPHLYEAYLLRGYNAYELLCATRCPMLSECVEHGFRGQVDKAKQAQVTVAPHPDLLFNPTYRSMAKQILPNNPEDSIVINEFNVFTRYLDITVGQSRLEYLSKTWYDHSLGTFAQLILKACLFEENPIAAIKTIIDNITDTERNNITIALTQYRIGDTILSRDEAQDLQKRSAPKNVSEVLALPLIETDDWNLLGQLEMFFEQYPNPDRAPMRWEKNTLSFAIPPLPMYTKSRVICMSATAEKHTFLHTFKHRQEKRGDVSFLDGNDTEWHPDAQVFQLRTNRNPRKTLLVAEQDANGNWIYPGELTASGKTYMEMILNSLSKTDGTQAFISHKPIVDTYRDKLDELGVKVGWFGGLAGLDAHFDRDKDDGITLHILGTPELPPHETEYRSKLLGITTEQVHDGSVKSEVMQSIGRAGLVKNPSKVILWTSLDLPSVTPRDQTLLFDDTDFVKVDGDLKQLPSVITARESAEANGDVKALIEAGVPKSTAYRNGTKPSKTERDARVLELHNQDKSSRQIDTETGINYKTVQRIIKNFEQSKS